MPASTDPQCGKHVKGLDSSSILQPHLRHLRVHLVSIIQIYNTVQQVDYSTSPAFSHPIETFPPPHPKVLHSSPSSLHFRHQANKVIIQELRHLRINNPLVVEIL